MELTAQLQDLDAFASRFWEALGRFRVFAFHGEMGAGKTTLISALCHHRGVRSNVSSPTFSIINEYVTADHPPVRIFHMDLYRLRDEEETESAGVGEWLRSGDYCFVEWPERAPNLFDDHTVHVYVDAISPEERHVEVKMP